MCFTSIRHYIIWRYATQRPESIWSTTLLPDHVAQSRHVCAIIAGICLSGIKSGRSWKDSKLIKVPSRDSRCGNLRWHLYTFQQQHVQRDGSGKARLQGYQPQTQSRNKMARRRFQVPSNACHGEQDSMDWWLFRPISRLPQRGSRNCGRASAWNAGLEYSCWRQSELMCFSQSCKRSTPGARDRRCFQGLQGVIVDYLGWR